MRRNATWTVPAIQSVHRGGRSRVEVPIAGTPLWFETGDAKLTPSVEGIATALLVPCLYHGCSLHLEGPVCKQWFNGVEQATEVLHRWWRYPARTPTVEAFATCSAPKGTGVGLFFTGGVDSFYSLLRFPRRITHLIYVVDYDVPPHARQRLSGFETHLRAIAHEVGATPIALRSNLRRHDASAGPSWRQSHGAALIGAAHLLTEAIREVVISSSCSRFHAQPWGSHWELDPHWSSASLQVTHFGDEFRRFDKLERIIDDQLLWRFVRPCWENPVDHLNCSVCEKCVRTQISIAACGDLARFTAFDHTVGLPDKIGQLRRIGSSDLIPIYADFLRLPSLSPYHHAIASLIRRSRMSAFRKTCRRTVRNWLAIGRPCLSE